MLVENLQTIARNIIETNDSMDIPNETIEVILNFASDIYYNAECDEPIQVPALDGDGNIDGYVSQRAADFIGFEFLSDAEFDALERFYRSINPTSSYFSNVGSDARGGKVPLPFTMGSLDQVYEGDIEEWIAQNNLENEYLVLSDKLDGTSGALVYSKNGSFNSAFSRGNGTLGANISRHIKKHPSLPKKTSTEYKFRNEAIIPVKLWPTVHDTTLVETGRDYKNARNYVAGKMNASDTDDIFIKHLDIVVTSMEYPETSKVTQFETARKEGFKTPYYEVVLGKDVTTEFLIEYLQTRKKETEYEIDGIVIDIDDLELRKSLTRKGSSLNPTFAKKFKVGDDSNLAQVRVTNVIWRPSKAGYLKPRVEIEPVDLAGVTITYATGFNAKFIRDNGIGPGALIEITRSGDVIPFIKRVIDSVEPAMPDEAEFGEMHWSDGLVDLILTDSMNNEQVQFYRILDFFKTLDVPNLKGGSLEKLMKAGFDTEEKIIKASELELKNAVGDSAGSKIYNGIKDKLSNIEMHILAAASQTLGRGQGRRKLERIIRMYDTLFVSKSDIMKVEGFEEKTASLVADNLPNFQAFLDSIDGYYSFAKVQEKPTTGSLKGIVVVFTGVRDSEFEAFIEANAGSIGSGVNKNTTYLICKDINANSSKLDKANKLGVKPLTLEEAKKELGYNG